MSNFEDLIKENYLFVDKTSFIELLEEETKYVSYLRPRKIGKSLFLSILECYYDINHKDKFEQLFGNTYIGQNPTPLANSYRVLKFDFSGINTTTRQSTEEGFLSNIRDTLSDFIAQHQLFDPSKTQKILSEKVPAQMMGAFVQAYRREETPIYLLIDEYDHFTNEILWRDLAEFRTSVSQDGYVRKF
ncbi:MAG: AAA family ATPase, partial [Bernardetiaceae bacterium]|nr:AAA family ATPase [Bernardetiaceae bacterium]